VLLNSNAVKGVGEYNSNAVKGVWVRLCDIAQWLVTRRHSSRKIDRTLYLSQNALLLICHGMVVGEPYCSSQRIYPTLYLSQNALLLI
jgi:hypothetical protein